MLRVAMLRLTNDNFEAFDAGRSTVLVGLDLSAAFDCIDHDTLINRLQHTYRVDGMALIWLQPYLSSLSSFVKWRIASSN
jgi:hypothetical protein